MKTLITAILLLFTMSASSQEINKVTHDEAGHVTGLINLCNREGFKLVPEMKERYDIEYPGYQADENTLTALKSLLKGKKISIVMGTWCGDSKFQVPHFYKILDQAGVSEKEITLICVDHSKQAENGLIDNLNIQRVPTFIVYENGKELGRIIEFPQDTLEKDLLGILVKK